MEALLAPNRKQPGYPWLTVLRTTANPCGAITILSPAHPCAALSAIAEAAYTIQMHNTDKVHKMK